MKKKYIIPQIEVHEIVSNVVLLAGSDNTTGSGSYDGGSSDANRGQHYVRGHYSRDEYSNDGYSERRDSRGRYSRDESKDMMMRKFDEMLGEAKTPAEREAIKKCIETMQDY